MSFSISRCYERNNAGLSTFDPFSTVHNTGSHVDFDGRHQQNNSSSQPLMSNPTITIDESDDDEDDHLRQYERYSDEYYVSQQPTTSSMNRHRGRDVHNKCCNNRMWCVKVIW